MWFEITSSGKFLIGVAVKASIICFWWIGPWRRVRTWQHCFRFPAVFHICVPCDEESARAGASDLFVDCFTISSLWVIFYKLLYVLAFLRVFVRDNNLVHCLKFVPEKNIFNLDIFKPFYRSISMYVRCKVLWLIFREEKWTTTIISRRKRGMRLSVIC